MEDVLAAPSPATELAPSEQAVAERDFKRYAEVENARQAGKPIPEASAPSTKTSAAAEKPAGTAPDPESGSTQEKPKGGRKPDAEARIQQLLAENKALKEQAGTGVKPPADPPPADKKPAETAKPDAPKRPVEEDFATYGEFVEALTTFRAKELIAADRAEREKAAADAKTAEEAQAAQQKLSERFEAAKAAHPDFEEVAFSRTTPISEAMHEFLTDSEHAGELLYKLGENGSAEGIRIAALSPMAAARELVKLEAAIAGEPAPKAPPPVKPKTTSAPKPPTQLGGTNVAPADEADEALAAKDVTRYMRVMNEREHKKQRG